MNWKNYEIVVFLGTRLCRDSSFWNHVYIGYENGIERVGSGGPEGRRRPTKCYS